MATLSLREEATELLQELIRVDTVNPPGNETRAAEVLREYLGDNGVESELLREGARAGEPRGADPGSEAQGRGSCSSRTRTPSSRTRRSGRLDPWSGELREGQVWGRGALDMKGQVAASAVAIASLAREGFEPGGDLIFAACADEEVGAGFGLQWLCQEHPEAVRAEYCVNEGAGDRLVLGGRVFYACSTAEKMSSPFRIIVHGRSGHASRPGIADNALVKAAPLIERLGLFQDTPELGPEVEAFLRAVTGEVPSPDRAVEAAREVHPLAGDLVESLLGTTVSPTQITASHGRNVIPARCEVIVDCRILPERTQAEVEARLREFLDVPDLDFEWLEGHGGTRSSMDTPLWRAIEAFVEEMDSGAQVVPLLLSGFTDSHWLREAFGTVAYGFFPMRTMDPEVAARLIHSADERIEVEDLELGVQFLRRAAEEIGSLPSTA